MMIFCFRGSLYCKNDDMLMIQIGGNYRLFLISKQVSKA